MPNINLYSKRYIFFVLSVIIMATGIITYFVKGFVFDIQFQGGTVIEMHANKDTFTANNVQQIQSEVAELVESSIGKSAYVQKSTTYDVNNKSDFDVIKISIGSNETLSSTEIQKVEQAIIDELKLTAEDPVISEESVEPFIGKEISQNGVKAVIIAAILIILYIWWRFKIVSGLSLGVFGVVGLLHDIGVMITVYLIFGIPVNDSFIAAMLTIFGYSMNDTIVIYDRIRENTRLMKKIPFPELVNTSIIQTMNRSINTTVTVLMAVITIFVFGKMNAIESITEFSFPLIIGLISGTYSTIFITTPLWVMWKESQKKSKVKPAKA
ncbi:preprotein translocase subunit SecF [Ruminiclostridium sufflavum DSM 19573]|uniref:Protein-export membrane protein SecF n=1 Tax=Ruminiclostridium sufflavum DSM 19573 TaxID=1121337 RepID=A0A318XM54_9FIRM|nr:protein translocase subunit SecF [Ruminiclostridium sufflavum]PYG87022.1 preprotein translocase subunit SecF [Ruminiclostridium sufflavum DSM 19573]